MNKINKNLIFTVGSMYIFSLVVRRTVSCSASQKAGGVKRGSPVPVCAVLNHCCDPPGAVGPRMCPPVWG